MQTEIIAHTRNGERIEGPDCAGFPRCATLMQNYLNFHEDPADCNVVGISNEFTAEHFRRAAKQSVIELRDIYRRRNVLLAEEVEMLYPPLPANIHEEEGLPTRFFMPWSTPAAAEDACGEEKQNGVPPGMIELREIRPRRLRANPDPAALQNLRDGLEALRIEYHSLWELVRFFRRCRAFDTVRITIR